MSEFQEAHTVSTLKGAPPGYVGYGKGGILTEAVRRKPYSVILLDEVEKAHPDVHEIFFQVFDKGMMDDSEGRRIDFKNTLILLTSNVGSEVIMDRTRNGAVRTGIDDLDIALRPPLLKVFPAAFLGRVVTIPYYPLSDAMIEAITRHQFGKIARRLKATNDAELVIGDGVMDLIKARCTEIESGGRMIDAILTNTLLPELSRGSSPGICRSASPTACRQVRSPVGPLRRFGRASRRAIVADKVIRCVAKNYLVKSKVRLSVGCQEEGGEKCDFDGDLRRHSTAFLDDHSAEWVEMTCARLGLTPSLE
ncbi:hypothetical protein Lal_00012842 [Lupinus albus]|nr:hypothetical protein Lal_00012842 [Lupinus albus]